MSKDKGDARMSIWVYSLMATAIYAVWNTTTHIRFGEETSVMELIFTIIFPSAIFFVVFAGLLKWWTSRKRRKQPMKTGKEGDKKQGEGKHGTAAGERAGGAPADSGPTGQASQGVDSEKSQRFPVERAKFRSAQPKMPWDVRALGWISCVLGGLGVLVGIMFLAEGREAPAGWERWTLFGTVHLTSGIVAWVWILISGILFLIEGWGLLRGRSWAWWLVLATHVEYAVSTYSHPSLLWSLPAAIVINVLFFAWLLFRAKLFRPFGRRTDARPTGPG